MTDHGSNHRYPRQAAPEPAISLLAVPRAIPGYSCLVALVAASLFPGVLSAASAGEWEVKGAFVLNFVRFVSWSGIPGEDGQKLPVCALANSDFATAVREAVAGKVVQDRQVSFRFDANPDPSRCRVLVLDEAEYPAAHFALKAVVNSAVLTIGNGPGLVEIGGMFELIVKHEKVRFNTNLDAIRSAGLQISANLLQLSQHLTGRTERPAPK